MAINLPATPPLNIYTDTTVAVESRYFYKIRVSAP